MCGILFTNKDISDFDIEHVLKFLKHRGPDYTSIKKIKDYSFIHTLLSMTGPLTEQPFYSKDENIICMFNGEIYNFDEFGDYHSDGECLIPLYEEYGTNFINNLDGEFAIVLVDIKKQILIYSTDIFGTRPLWIGFDGNEFGISTYKSCLERIGIKNSHQVLSNQTNIFDLNQLKLIATNRVHSFDLTQHKTNFDDWNKAFENSIRKRVKHAKCDIYIGMSAGYDSGAIGCELTKQNINFTAYSITNVENKDIMEQRKKIVKKSVMFDIERDDFLSARQYLKDNAEEYELNIDNGERDKYFKLIQNENYDKAIEKSLLNVINFRKSGQILTDDNGAIGCSYIASLAKAENAKIYLSGSGADEIFSDYGFNGIKYFEHSTIGGHFPDDLSSVFPWKNFFRNTQRAYLMKEEHVAGSYGIEGRYPFLDKYVVQEFLWLSAELKNKNYKSPLDNYLKINNFPYEREKKEGFGCGYSGPTQNNKGYTKLAEHTIQQNKGRMVTDIVNSRKVDFSKNLKKTYEHFINIDKSKIVHVKDNLYMYDCYINDLGLKYSNKCSYIILEDYTPMGYVESNHDIIAKNGKGGFCFWTSITLYFSTSDNSNPITNNKNYSIDKL